MKANNINQIRTVLILGGTLEARLLASALQPLGLRIITSLAGILSKAPKLEGEIKLGGFGGVIGLIAYLDQENIDLVIDATHPFAANMSHNGFKATAALNIPLIRLERAPWHPKPHEHWQEVLDIPHAIKAVPKDTHVFLSLGGQQLKPWFVRSDLDIVARMIEEPEFDLPPHITRVLGRPPFSLEAERRFLGRQKFDWLITKNSGGDMGRAKLDVAYEQGISVMVITRPQKPEVLVYENVADLLAGYFDGQS